MSATAAGSGVATLLVVHHSPGTALPAMVDAAAVISALEVTSSDVLGAAGYLLATPANLGYMSGALKHAFDTTYNDALDRTQGRPYGVLVHGESDTDGALIGIQKIVTGLAWRAVAEP
ncbi:MAG: flavodoxin family protein, partial [Actinobacteria bacterium]|nr:flavodoxin family protein [Actinomycetota bacterium]